MKKLAKIWCLNLSTGQNRASKSIRIFFMMSMLVAIQLFALSAYSQTAVTGTVKDSKTSEPLPGVNVVVVGTTQGTITDINGKFSLNVTNANVALSFSFIGYTTQTLQLEGKTSVDVALVEEATNLDEIVVIGYGTVKKSDLTGSVAVVTSEQLNRTPASNLTSAIQGKASGVVVTQSGSPGGKVNLRVRGIGTINTNPDPLYVIDGIVGADINSISPSDIESFQVLKDASAAAIYGANGSNGVVIITTKRGKSGDTKINFSSFFSINRSPKKFDLMNADEYIDFYSKIYGPKQLIWTDEFRQAYYGADWRKGTDWQEEILQDSYTQNYYLNVAGGGEKSNYSISTGYYKGTGILRGSAADRFTIRANSDFQIGKYVKMGESINLSRFDEQRPTNVEGDPWQLSLIDAPIMRVFNSKNKGGYEGPRVPFFYDAIGDTINNTGLFDKGNPRAPLDLGKDKKYTNTVSTSFYLEIKPFDWLTLKSTPSVDYKISNQNNWMPAYDGGVRSVPEAKLYVKYDDATVLSWENQITFAKTFDKHSISLTGVNHVRKGYTSELIDDAKGFDYESINVVKNALTHVPDGAQSEWSMNSYLARLIYDYNSFILITGSLRKDYSSNFGPTNRWSDYFPSFSTAVKVKDLFFSNLDFISSAKLRFGWGKTGNSNIGSFRYFSQVAAMNEFSPVFGDNQKISPAINELNSIGNAAIKWEAAAMNNFGIDLNLFGNAIEFSGEYYIKNNKDLIIQKPVPLAFGREGLPYVNIGKIQNRGFEFDIKYKKLSGDFTYTLSANLTTVKNEVIDIPASIFNDEDNPTNITRKGNTIGSIYGYVCEGIIQTSDTVGGGYKFPVPSGAMPGDLKFKDLNRDGIIDDKDRTVIGKPIPDFTYSFNIELGYKNFDFNMFLFGMQNYDVLNGLRRDIESFSSQDKDHNKSLDFAKNFWTPENKSTKYIRADRTNKNDNYRLSTWWLEDASFLRIKDVQLGYKLPQSVLDRLHISSFRVYVSAVNLYTFTNYTGRDPEAPINANEPRSAGIDNGTYPLPRIYTAGVQLGF